MSIQRVIDTLVSLDEQHQEMLKISQIKKTAIIENDVEKLIEIMNQESRAVKKIEKLDQDRIEACGIFLQEKGVKSQLQLTVTELSRLVFDPEEKNLLKQVQSQLSSTLDELKQLNDLNQKLIEQSLIFIDYSLELFGGNEDEVTYHHPADRSTGVQRSGLFDTRG